MSDPTAETIGQIAESVQGSPVSEAELAQRAAAAAGLGVTGVDVDALAASIASMQARLNELEAEKAQAAGNPLADTTKTIQYFLAGHGDAKAVELGNDLAAAVEAAGTSGDSSRVAATAERLDRYLAKTPPYHGENYFYNNSVAFVSDLPEIIVAFQAAQVPSPAPVPSKVVAGTVVG